MDSSRDADLTLIILVWFSFTTLMSVLFEMDAAIDTVLSAKVRLPSMLLPSTTSRNVAPEFSLLNMCFSAS